MLVAFPFQFACAKCIWIDHLSFIDSLKEGVERYSKATRFISVKNKVSERENKRINIPEGKVNLFIKKVVQHTNFQLAECL
jgi:hypothetical protein